MSGPDAVMSVSTAIMSGPDAVMSVSTTIMSGPEAIMSESTAVMSGPDAVMSGPDVIMSVSTAIVSGPDAIVSVSTAIMCGQDASTSLRTATRSARSRARLVDPVDVGLSLVFPRTCANSTPSGSISSAQARNRRPTRECPYEGREDDARTPRGTPAPRGAPRRPPRNPSEKRDTHMSRTTVTKTKAAALAQVQALIAGTTQHFPNGSFTIGGTVYTSASLVQVLQGLASAMTAQRAAQAGARDALAAEHAAATQVGPILLAYKRLVLAAFANTAQTLVDFGLGPPRARTPLTTEQLATRAAKAKATRVARGTMSRKQKLAVKGDVTGVVVTPVTAATVPTPPAAPVSR
jgi:hypothetical protein